MKITRKHLRGIIKEELRRVLLEADKGADMPYYEDFKEALIKVTDEDPAAEEEDIEVDMEDFESAWRAAYGNKYTQQKAAVGNVLMQAISGDNEFISLERLSDLLRDGDSLDSSFKSAEGKWVWSGKPEREAVKGPARKGREIGEEITDENGRVWKWTADGPGTGHSWPPGKPQWVIIGHE